MTSFTVGFLTLCTWIISSCTLPALDQQTEYCQDEHYQENQTLSIPCNYYVFHDIKKTKPSSAVKGSPEMVVAFEKILAFERCTVCLVDMLFDSCLSLLQSVNHNENTAEKNREMCKCEVLQLGVLFLSETACLLYRMETYIGDQSMQLHYRNVYFSSLLVRSEIDCTGITTVVLLQNWRTDNYFNFFKEWNRDGHILQHATCADLRTRYLKYQILKMCGNHMIYVSSDGWNRVYLRICCIKILLMSLKEAFSKEAFMIQKEIKRFDVCTNVWDAHLASSRCVGRVLLATGLLMVIYTRLKINPTVSAHNSNTTMGMLFIIALHYSSERSIMFSYIVCDLVKPIHIVFVYKAVHLVLNRFCPSHLKSMAIPVTLLILWITFIVTFLNKNLKNLSIDVHEEGILSSTHILRSVLGQSRHLACLYISFALTSFLLQFILTKLNCLNVLCHLQLVTYPQNLRTPRKYILFVRIYRFISF